MNILNIANKAKLLLNNDITYVILGVTAHCNAKCNHCFYWHNIEKAKNILDSVDTAGSLCDSGRYTRDGRGL